MESLLQDLMMNPGTDSECHVQKESEEKNPRKQGSSEAVILLAALFLVQMWKLKCFLDR